jgi:hypothetical protein
MRFCSRHFYTGSVLILLAALPLAHAYPLLVVAGMGSLLLAQMASRQPVALATSSLRRNRTQTPRNWRA